MWDSVSFLIIMECWGSYVDRQTAEYEFLANFLLRPAPPNTD